MAFWSTPMGKGDGEPKRKFRFTIQFEGLTGQSAGVVEAGSGQDAIADGILWYAKSVAKPSFTVTETDHTFINQKFYYPGRVEWETVSFTLVDPADSANNADGVEQMNRIIKASGYEIFTNTQGLRTISKGKSSHALGKVIINQIDAEGVNIESWTLNNAFVTEMKFGELDYTGDELIELTLTLRYDWATCDIGDNQYYGTQA